MSVHGVKRDPSSDISYSSWNADKKAWASKGCFTSKTNRWATAGWTALNSMEKPNQIDAMYEPRKGMAKVQEEHLCGPSTMRSKHTKYVDINAMKHGRTRLANARIAFAYSNAIGPGDYTDKTISDIKYGPGSLFDAGRESAVFQSLPRTAAELAAVPDTSDVLKRDGQNWISKGFYSTHQTRFQPMSMINDSGKHRSMYNIGGLYGMAQKSRVPAFDAQYDTDSGGKKSMSRKIQEGPAKYSNAFKSDTPRFKNVPTWKQNDSRGAHATQSTDEWIGPGTYDVPATAIGTNNVHTGTQLAMYDTTFRGPSRFRSSGSQSPYQDSSLMKTW